MIVIGLSSGTSVDGIDVGATRLALDGDTVELTPLGHLEVAFPDGLRRAVLDALPPAPTTCEAVCRIDTALGHAFADAARRGIAELAGGRADLVVSHGQTLFHDVADGAVHGTLQLGQPAWIAEATGLPVVSDLRARDVAAGGQGAPLASVLDVLLLGDRAAALGAPVAALNLGGIANVTVVGAGTPAAFDTGPANALLDTAVRRATGEQQDTGGIRALRGTADPDALAALQREPFYGRRPPKSTGKELFDPGYLDRVLAGSALLDPARVADLLATLVELTAATVADALRPYGVAEVLVSGGGARNPAVVAALERRLAPARLRPVESVGLPGDGKEAHLFALLGFLTWHGVAATVPTCTGATAPTLAGRISPGAGPLRLPDPAPPPSRLRIVPT